MKDVVLMRKGTCVDRKGVEHVVTRVVRYPASKYSKVYIEKVALVKQLNEEKHDERPNT